MQYKLYKEEESITFFFLFSEFSQKKIVSKKNHVSDFSEATLFRNTTYFKGNTKTFKFKNHG